jgi:magnesium transporter
MGEIVEGLDAAARERIRSLLADERFFWLDVRLDRAAGDELGSALGVSGAALEALTDFGEHRRLWRRFHADGQRVAFPFTCYRGPTPIEVHVLVTGDFVLTVHRERVSLPELLGPYMPEGRSEQFVVYAVLDAMVGSAFDALNEIELSLDNVAVMSADLRGGRLRMATLRRISARLSKMRRRFGPQRGVFERIGEEIVRLDGLDSDHERYFDRIGQQVNRLVEAIDAAANALARLIDLRLNETNYWLTVVATIFLPLTFITGFFGMNFGWMVRGIDSQLAFWLLGIGTPVVGVLLIWRLIVRGSPGG